MKALMTEHISQEIETDGEVKNQNSRTEYSSKANVVLHCKSELELQNGDEHPETDHLELIQTLQNLKLEPGLNNSCDRDDQEKKAWSTNEVITKTFDIVDGPVSNHGQQNIIQSQNVGHFQPFYQANCFDEYLAHGGSDPDVETDEAPLSMEAMSRRPQSIGTGGLLHTHRENRMIGLEQTFPYSVSSQENLQHRGPPLFQQFNPDIRKSNFNPIHIVDSTISDIEKILTTSDIEDILRNSEDRTFPVSTASSSFLNGSVYTKPLLEVELTPPHSPSSSTHCRLQTQHQQAPHSNRISGLSPPLTPRGTPSPKSVSRNTPNIAYNPPISNGSGYSNSERVPSTVHSYLSVVPPNPIAVQTSVQLYGGPSRNMQNGSVGGHHSRQTTESFQTATLNVDNTRKRKHNDDHDNVPEVDSDGDSLLHTLAIIPKHMVKPLIITMFSNNKELNQYINLQNKVLQTPLLVAVLNDSTYMARYFISCGADVNIPGKIPGERDTYTIRAPLHIAASKGDNSLDLVTMLLQAEDIEVNKMCPGDGFSPLHLALQAHQISSSGEIIHNCHQVVQELIQSGADLNQPDVRSSKTPLMKAIETRDVSLVKSILSSVTNPNQCRSLLKAQTRDGNTSLHIAAGLSRLNFKSKVTLLRLLVRFGADCNMENKEGDFPRDLAGVDMWDQAVKMNLK